MRAFVDADRGGAQARRDDALRREVRRRGARRRGPRLLARALRRHARALDRRDRAVRDPLRELGRRRARAGSRRSPPARRTRCCTARAREADELRGELERVAQGGEAEAEAGRRAASSRAAKSAVGGVNVIVEASATASDADALLDLSDRLKQRAGAGGGRARLARGRPGAPRRELRPASSAERLDASTSSSAAAAVVGGGGGGRPTMARAGGKDPEKLGDALARRRAEALRRRARREGARARLRLGAHRRRRLRPDRHARAAARRRRARRDGGRARAARRDRARARSAERVVVGLPLTLRGEHGEQARETERFVERLRAARRRPGRDATTSASRPALAAHGDDARGRARRRAPAVELPRVVERRAGVMPPRPRPPRRCGAVVARRLIASPCSSRSSRRSRSQRVRRRHGAEAATTDRVAAAAEAAPDRLPRGLHARADGRAHRRRSTRSRSAKRARRRRALRAGVPRRDAPLGAPGRSRRDGARTLEGFLFPATYDFFRDDLGEAARRRPARRVPPRTGRSVDLRTRGRRT